MPYRIAYEPAPKNLNLKVYEYLPDGAHEQRFSIGGIREATRVNDGHIEHYHYCERCGGWIEGTVNEFKVNTLEPEHLAGRQGTEYYCRRCGEEIGFIGLMS